MSSTKAWISASRPKTLPFGLSPVIVGSALGLHYGHFSWATFALCFFTALFLQIGANYANDVFDFEKGADTNKRVGPIRAVASGDLTAQNMKLGMVLSFSFAFLFAMPVIWNEGWILALLFLLLVVVAIGYSGGPKPLAYVGFGEITNLLFMAGIPTLTMCFVQTHEIHYSSFWLGLCFGGLTSAVMCLNNLRDEKTDRIAGKKSLVVKFGQRFGQSFYSFLLIYPFLVPWLLIYLFGLPVAIGASSLLALPCIPLIRAVFASNKPAEFSELFSKTALLALLYALTLSYGLMV